MNFYDTLSCTAFKLIGSFKLTGYLRYLLIEAEPTFWGYSAIQKQTLKFLMSYNTCNQKKKQKQGSRQNGIKETFTILHKE